MSTFEPGNEQLGAALQADTRFCTSCGHASSGGRFCGSCGTAVDASTAAAGPAAATGTLPRVPAQPMPAETVAATDEHLVDEHPTVTLERSGHTGGFAGLTWEDEPHDDVAGPADAASARRRLQMTRRQGLVGAVSLLMLAVLVVAAVFTGRYVADGDLRQALSASSRAFNSTVEDFSSATDAEQVATASGKSDSAVDQIDQALRVLGAGSDPEDRSVRAQLEAEKGVLVALGQLDGLATEPLASWGDAHTELTGALESETQTRAALARVRGDHARSLADTTLMLSKITAAVGPALVDDATAESVRLLKTLGEAKTTADLRKLGDAAAAEQSAVAAAAEALPDGNDRQVLSGYAAALSALGNLARISGESTSGWTAARAELAETFGQVAAAAGSTGGSGVRVVLDGSLDAADKVVASAAAAIADWMAKTDGAIKARTSDGEALTSYASFFRSQAKTYEQLREDLSSFTKRVEDPGVYYYEAYAFMSQAEQDRRDVRDFLVSTDVPTGMGGAHQEVVSAIDRAIGAVQSAYDGLSQSEDCYEGCPYYLDTPGWQRFQSESDGIRKAYGSAMSRWESELSATKAQIANRPLPAKPSV